MLKAGASYEVTQRPQGFVDTSVANRPAYNLRTDFGGILRYSFCTPSFILGTQMLPSRPNDDWAKISSQNRSHGVLFEGDPVSFILPQCEKRQKEPGVQHSMVGPTKRYADMPKAQA